MRRGAFCLLTSRDFKTREVFFCVRDCSGYPFLPAAYVLHVRAKKIGTESPTAGVEWSAGSRRSGMEHRPARHYNRRPTCG